VTNLVNEKPAWTFAVEYDGGDKSCGDLILDLRNFFVTLPSGTRVCVIARDPGAWIDIPAWCRVAEHGFIDEVPPFYLIERK
jgi:TusA-related sulfurtransferase